jgi:manganese/zinc/iron transport system substrate-binding protein
MVTDIVARVAGDKASVKGIMGAGVDPHLYKPTRDDVAALMRADVVFYSGLMLEGKMSSVFEKMAKRKPVHAVTQLIDESYILESEDQAGHPDPHVWMDPAAWARAVEAVAAKLSRFDPSNERLYHSNARGLTEECLALSTYGRSALESVSPNRRVLISSHDAFRYFGRAFGLEVYGVQGISTESEAGLRRINKLADAIYERGIPAVFVESSVPRKTIQALVQGLRARGRELLIGGELFSDAMGEPGTYEGTYIGMIDHNITTIARALGGKAPERGMNGRLSGGKT